MTMPGEVWNQTHLVFETVACLFLISDIMNYHLVRICRMLLVINWRCPHYYFIMRSQSSSFHGNLNRVSYPSYWIYLPKECFDTKGISLLLYPISYLWDGTGGILVEHSRNSNRHKIQAISNFIFVVCVCPQNNKVIQSTQECDNDFWVIKS